MHRSISTLHMSQDAQTNFTCNLIIFGMTPYFLAIPGTYSSNFGSLPGFPGFPGPTGFFLLSLAGLPAEALAPSRDRIFSKLL